VCRDGQVEQIGDVSSVSEPFVGELFGNGAVERSTPDSDPDLLSLAATDLVGWIGKFRYSYAAWSGFTDSLRPCVGMAKLSRSATYLRYQNPSSASCSATRGAVSTPDSDPDLLSLAATDLVGWIGKFRYSYAETEKERTEMVHILERGAVLAPLGRVDAHKPVVSACERVTVSVYFEPSWSNAFRIPWGVVYEREGEQCSLSYACACALRLFGTSALDERK
jgi:hypothetical protein